MNDGRRRRDRKIVFPHFPLLNWPWAPAVNHLENTHTHTPTHTPTWWTMKYSSAEVNYWGGLWSAEVETAGGDERMEGRKRRQQVFKKSGKVWNWRRRNVTESKFEVLLLWEVLKKCFLSPQLAFEVLGEHPEEPSLHLRRPRDGGGGRVAARHLSDLHGRLHQIRAQTQQSQYTQTKIVQSVFKSQETDRASPLCLRINTHITGTNRRSTAHKPESFLRESGEIWHFHCQLLNDRKEHLNVLYSMLNLQEDRAHLELYLANLGKVSYVSLHSITLRIEWFVKGVWWCCGY